MLTKLIELVWQKNKIDQTQEWYKGSTTYFNGLKDEVSEVEEEIKENNKVYLEDELWDILRVYFNMIEWLKQEWKIDSLESIIKRSEKKFGQRIDAISWINSQKERSTAWKKIKKIQKEENKKEHEKLFWNN